MTYQLPLKLTATAAVVLSLAACGGSSSSRLLSAQAVDGYIAGADVLCDGMENGETQAAGRFDCPAGTVLSSISGGYDVGTDELETTSDVPFTGVLEAPATQPFVTPMSTISVAIARQESADGTFQAANYTAALESVAATFGVSARDLSQNPVTNLATAKLNAQVHQIMTAFAPGVNDYSAAVAAVAAVVNTAAQANRPLNLTTDVGVLLAAVNNELAISSPSLAVATADLDQVTANVTSANTAIENAASPDRVAEESKAAIIAQAPVTIDRDNSSISVFNEDSGVVQELDIADFENSTETDGLYIAQLSSGLTRINYNSNVFRFNQNINNTRVTVGFEVESVNAGDSRSISFISEDIVVNANRGDSNSLSISFSSQNATFALVGTDRTGTVTNATVQTDGETFRSDGVALTIDLSKINGQLANLGFTDLLETDGDYSVTLVIDGLRVNEQEGTAAATSSEEFTIDSGADSVTGNGFKGYISVRR